MRCANVPSVARMPTAAFGRGEAPCRRLRKMEDGDADRFATSAWTACAVWQAMAIAVAPAACRVLACAASRFATARPPSSPEGCGPVRDGGVAEVEDWNMVLVAAGRRRLHEPPLEQECRRAGPMPPKMPRQNWRFISERRFPEVRDGPFPWQGRSWLPSRPSMSVAAKSAS